MHREGEVALFSPSPTPRVALMPILQMRLLQEVSPERGRGDLPTVIKLGFEPRFF